MPTWSKCYVLTVQRSILSRNNEDKTPFKKLTKEIKTDTILEKERPYLIAKLLSIEEANIML